MLRAGVKITDTITFSLFQHMFYILLTVIVDLWNVNKISYIIPYHIITFGNE